MSDRPDFDAAGWGWSGAGDEDRLRIPRPAEVSDPPTWKTIPEICGELFILQQKYAKLRRDYWHNIFRAFALGAIVAWLLWSFLGTSP